MRRATLGSVEQYASDASANAYARCAAGIHVYRMVEIGPNGTDEGALYRCETCGSTDPEGDSL